MIQFYLSAINNDEERTIVENLYNNYKQLMYKTAYSILHNSELSEDSVHEAFLRIIDNIQNFTKYSCKENVSYLVIIVRGIALNKLKQSNRETILDEDFADSINIEEEADANIEYSEIVERIKNLSASLKNVAFLHFVKGCSAQEIAKMLNIKINTVYSSISRTKAILKNKRGDHK